MKWIVWKLHAVKMLTYKIIKCGITYNFVCYIVFASETLLYEENVALQELVESDGECYFCSKPRNSCVALDLLVKWR